MQQANHLLILNQPLPRTANDSKQAYRSLEAPVADNNTRMGDRLGVLRGACYIEQEPGTTPMLRLSQSRKEAAERNKSFSISKA